MSLEQIPGRVFLDSSTLQTLQDYGEYIYDDGEIAQVDKIWSIPNGYENIDALRKIMIVGHGGALQFVLSNNSLMEVSDRGNSNYLQWAFEMLDYWEGCLATYEDKRPAFSVKGILIVRKLQKHQFGYLSTKDAALIKDAILLECDVFLTMERKLPKNATHLEQKLGIKVLQPICYWNLLKPWAALLV